MKPTKEETLKEIKAIRKQMAVTSDAKTYRVLLAKLGGICGRGSEKRRLAGIRANEVRWGKVKNKGKK